MRWIVASSLRFRWLVVFAAAGLIAFGLTQIPNTKVDVFPEFAPPQVEIQTIALGNSSNEVEEFITVPLEERLNGIPGLADLRSKSVSQLSSIRLIFDRGTDELRARQLVQERLSQVTASLPTWAAPPWMMPPLSATSRIMKIGLSPKGLNLIEMSSIAYWKIRQRLLRVPGVAQVNIFGERLQQRHVQVDPKKLAENGVSLNQVMETTANAFDAGVLQYTQSFLPGTGGFVESGGRRLNIENVQPLTQPEDLAKVPVAERGGKVLRLGDVARVREDTMPLWGDAVINDGPGLMLIVQKFRGANTMEVTRGIEDAIDELRPGLPGMAIDTTIFRPATFVEQSLDNLTRALIIGIALVVLIIAAFLFEFRTAFISLIAIPLSLIAAVLVLDLQGATVNVMVLAGLVVAIGVVVDDAIIDVENIVRRLRQARAVGSDRSTFRIVLDASVEVRSAITYATVINVVAIVPVLFLESLSGAFFRPLVLTYGLAVLVSMLVALTVTPALCLILLSRGKLDRRESPLLSRAQARVRVRAGQAPAPAQPGDGARRGPGAGGHPHLPDARVAAPAQLQGARLPHALAHGARDLRAGGAADLRARVQGPARDPRRAQLRLAHRSGAGGRRGLRPVLRRELDQHRQERRLRQDAGRRPPDRRGLPGPLPRRADLPARAHQGGPDRLQRVDRRADLRAQPGDPAFEVRRDRRAHREDPGRHRRPRGLLDRPAARRGRGRPGRGPALRPQARRHPPPVVDAAGQRGGQRPLLPGQGLRRARLEHPVGARQRDRRAEPPDRHAGGRADPAVAGRGRPRRARRRTTSCASRQSRRIDVGANVEGRDLQAVVDDVEDALEGVSFPVGLPRRGARRVDRAQRGAGPAAASSASPRRS